MPPVNETVAIAVVQLCSSQDVSLSLAQLSSVLAELKPGAVDAIFLPENFAALAAPSAHQIGLAEAEGPGFIRNFIANKAIETGAYIFAGTVPLAKRADGQMVPGQKVRAASLVFDPCGAEIARYDKQHLFDVDVPDQIGRYRESDTFEPGDAPRVVATAFGAVGLSVCYDLRFPEFFTRLTALGAEIIAVPSAFTAVTGAAHFEVLVRARAIENACFLVAACQSGGHDSGRETFGHSMVVSPWGEVLACREAGPGVFVTTLDLQDLRRVRSALPSWRRPIIVDRASV